MRWRVPRFWEDGDVWIIGGGPSITEQFKIPNNIVQGVLRGELPPSAYSPYMSFLHKKHVIGVNAAYLIGDWIDIVFFGDHGFFLRHKAGLAAFPGLKVSCTPYVEKHKWVKFVARDTSHPRGLTSNPEMVSWNFNSGAAAINLAVHTGARRIILLGFDMKLSSANRQHWHDVYKVGEIKSQKQLLRLPFDRHLRPFPMIAQDARKLGVEILNANPDSQIDCFPKFSLKELLYDNS